MCASLLGVVQAADPSISVELRLYSDHNGFEPAVFRDEHHASESKVTNRGAYKAALCKGRNEVARCSGNIEGRLQTRELGSSWHSLCGLQRRKFL